MVSQLLAFKVLAAAYSLFSAANAHMIMSSPVPYGKSTLDNSPLIADGSDFPCKQRSGVYDLEGAANNIVIGVPQTLSFIGSAVHGGGSCQVSLTTDLAPTASTQWMVIHSIEGGCPSNVTGNLDANAAGTGAAVFQYTVPPGIAPGQYTIAWSWVNKIGNREFYMNCGPATITAAAKKRYAPEPKVRRQSSFPNLFVANLQGVDNGCTTTEGVDIEYPDPGASVEKGNIGVSFGPPVGCAGSAAQVSAPSSVASASAAASSVAGSSVAESSAAAQTSAVASSVAPGVFATGSAVASSAAPAEATSTAFVSPVPVASSAAGSAPAAPSSSTTPSTTGSSAVQSGPCTPEGEWFCSADGSSYQRCASGVWSVPMAMAAGTTCTPGLSADLAMAAGKSKRHAHRRRGHDIFAVSQD